MKYRNYIVIASLLVLVGCGLIFQDDSVADSGHTIMPVPDQTIPTAVPELLDIEERLESMGLVNIQEVDPTIQVDLRYSSANNFIGEDVYGDLNNCYLQPEVAEKLMLAQLLLRAKYPSYSIIVFDGVRPRSIQKRMWEVVDLPADEKIKYLSNPVNGSVHQYGAAVDVSLVDEKGNELDMGTEFDYFGELAYPSKEDEMLAQGLLTEEHISNRQLLRYCMIGAGFRNLPTEWWHFNSVSRSVAQTLYSPVE